MADIKHYTDEELREIATKAVRREKFAKSLPESLLTSLAQGLLVAQGILPLGDRTPRLAKILKQIILEQK